MQGWGGRGAGDGGRGKGTDRRKEGFRRGRGKVNTVTADRGSCREVVRTCWVCRPHPSPFGAGPAEARGGLVLDRPPRLFFWASSLVGALGSPSPCYPFGPRLMSSVSRGTDGDGGGRISGGLRGHSITDPTPRQTKPDSGVPAECERRGPTPRPVAGAPTQCRAAPLPLSLFLPPSLDLRRGARAPRAQSGPLPVPGGPRRVTPGCPTRPQGSSVDDLSLPPGDASPQPSPFAQAGPSRTEQRPLGLDRDPSA